MHLHTLLLPLPLEGEPVAAECIRHGGVRVILTCKNISVVKERYFTYLLTIVQHSLQLVNIPAREVVAVENLWREITHLSTYLYLV